MFQDNFGAMISALPCARTAVATRSTRPGTRLASPVPHLPDMLLALKHLCTEHWETSALHWRPLHSTGDLCTPLPGDLYTRDLCTEDLCTADVCTALETSTLQIFKCGDLSSNEIEKSVPLHPWTVLLWLPCLCLPLPVPAAPPYPRTDSSCPADCPTGLCHCPALLLPTAACSQQGSTV